MMFVLDASYICPPITKYFGTTRIGHVYVDSCHILKHLFGTILRALFVIPNSPLPQNKDGLHSLVVISVRRLIILVSDCLYLVGKNVCYTISIFSYFISNVMKILPTIVWMPVPAEYYVIQNGLALPGERLGRNRKSMDDCSTNGCRTNRPNDYGKQEKSITVMS